MTKEEILNGMSEEEFYRLYPDQESWENAQQMKLGGLSGAPHNGQPTADQFFSYGSHANDGMNIPMSNPFYLATGGTPYYGGPLYPAQEGGDYNSPTNYGSFNVVMQYGGSEFGGAFDQTNNQSYPELQSGGDKSALIKMLIAAGKAKKKALGGDTVTQGGNSDNYPEEIKNSFRKVLDQNIQKNNIDKQLSYLKQLGTSQMQNDLYHADKGVEWDNMLNKGIKNAGRAALNQAPQTYQTQTQTRTPYQADNAGRFSYRKNDGSNRFDYNPNSYYKINKQGMNTLGNMPENYGIKSVENTYGAGARLASNIAGLFGKDKAAKTLGKFAPKKMKYTFGAIDGNQGINNQVTSQSVNQNATQGMTGPSNMINGMPNYLLPGMYSPINKPGRPTQQSILQNKQLPMQNYKDTEYEDYINNSLNPAYPVYNPQVQDTYDAGYKDVPQGYGYAYGGYYQAGGGNPGGNPTAMEDITVTANRKRDIDYQKIGMAIPRVMDIFSNQLEKNQIKDASATANVYDKKFVNKNIAGQDKGDYGPNSGILREGQRSYSNFYGTSPAAEGIATIKYGGNIYQDGGDNDQQQQIIQGVSQMLQQGAQPEQVAQQLVQMGISQDQALQLIQSIMQQMQEGQQMKQGGSVNDQDLDMFDVDQEYEVTDEMMQELRNKGYEFNELD